MIAKKERLLKEQRDFVPPPMPGMKPLTQGERQKAKDKAALNNMRAEQAEKAEEKEKQRERKAVREAKMEEWNNGPKVV